MGTNSCKTQKRHVLVKSIPRYNGELKHKNSNEDEDVKYVKEDKSLHLVQDVEHKNEKFINKSPAVKKKVFKNTYVWKNILIFVLMHLIAVYICIESFLYWPGWSPILIQISYALLTNLGVTAGAHRLWSHKAYKTTRPIEFILSIIFIAAGQNDLYEWVRDHRCHHKFSETDADPHNAKRGFFFAHMGWLCVKKHPDVLKKGKTIDMSDIEKIPFIKFQRKYYVFLHPCLVLFLPTFIVMRYSQLGLVRAFLTSVVRYIIVLHFTWLVNSAAHLWGTRPYNDKISPRESPVAIVGTFFYGEGYHNYHHSYPFDYRASEHGWLGQFNITALLIDILAFFNLAYDLRKTSQNVIEAAKRNVSERQNIKNS